MTAAPSACEPFQGPVFFENISLSVDRKRSNPSQNNIDFPDFTTM